MVIDAEHREHVSLSLVEDAEWGDEPAAYNLAGLQPMRRAIDFCDGQLRERLEHVLAQLQRCVGIAVGDEFERRLEIDFRLGERRTFTA